MTWRLHAACRGSDNSIFFPSRERGLSLREAKQICQSCVVKAECLEWAVAMREPFGVWGGLSERQRRVLRKERAA